MQFEPFPPHTNTPFVKAVGSSARAQPRTSELGLPSGQVQRYQHCGATEVGRFEGPDVARYAYSVRGTCAVVHQAFRSHTQPVLGSRWTN